MHARIVTVSATAPAPSRLEHLDQMDMPVAKRIVVNSAVHRVAELLVKPWRLELVRADNDPFATAPARLGLERGRQARPGTGVTQRLLDPQLVDLGAATPIPPVDTLVGWPSPTSKT
jgi:hypothetical protein